VNTGNLTFSGPVSLGSATRTITVANAGPDVLSGVISGTGTAGLIKDGTGALTLGNANTYPGGTTINAGILEAAAAGALGNGNVTVSAGTLKLSNASAMASTATLTVPTSPSGNADLSFNGRQRISTLKFGSTTKAVGTWGSLTSVAYYKDGAFTGNGLLEVGNNNPPVGYDLGPLGAVSTVALRVEVIVGKTPPTDADSGDVPLLKINWVQSPTANGGTATIIESGATILYTAPSGYSSDTFTYTVDDGKSVSLPATVSATVSAYSGQYSPNYVSGSGHFEGANWVMQFRGIPNVTYGIERASSVSGPWTRLTPDVTADSTGLVTLSDSGGGVSSFYRTVYP
jgi:autotransporter-associated beta strand protein